MTLAQGRSYMSSTSEGLTIRSFHENKGIIFTLVTSFPFHRKGPVYCLFTLSPKVNSRMTETVS